MEAEQAYLRMDDEFACTGRLAILSDGSGKLSSVPSLGMREAPFRDDTILVGAIQGELSLQILWQNARTDLCGNASG